MKNEFIPLFTPGPYAVNSEGEVLSLNYRHSGKPHLLSPRGNKSGHYTVCLCIDGKQITRGIHDVVWEAFNKKNVPEGYVVHHKNDKPWDNRLSNLELLSRRDHGRKHWSRPVLETNLAGDFIKEWPCGKDAADFYGWSVYQNLRGLTSSAYGRVFKYKD